MRTHSSLIPILSIWIAISSACSTADAASYLPESASGERFLFVVDKSSDMEKLKDASEATIYDMVGSGIYGQMQAGDTFGVWTFNKQTSAGRFAMEVWDPRKSRQQATIVAAFISGVEYENSSNLKDVIEKVRSVVGSVSNVNVFIISDGDSQMKGTPFDKTINAEYKRQRKQRASSKRPFITTLIARDGWIIDQSVTIGGTRIELPPRRLPPPPTPPAIAANSTTSPVVASPIVQLPPPTTSQATPPASKPAPKMTIITKKPEATNLIVAVSSPAPTPQIATTIAESDTLTSPTIPIPTTPTAPQESAPAQIASQESILSDANRIASTTPAPAARIETAKAETPIHPSVPAPAAIATTPSAIESIFTKLAPEPKPVAARESSPTSASENPGSTATLQGVGTPVATDGNPILQIAFGGLMLAAALLLAFTVLRQRRPSAGASLITQSMDRR